MSKNPRTDAVIEQLVLLDDISTQTLYKHACQLERELNESKPRSPTLKSAMAAETDRDQWRTMAQELAGELRECQINFNRRERSAPKLDAALSRFNELNQDQPLIKRNYVITEQELIEALKRSDRGEPEPTEPSPTNAKMSRPTLATAIARYATHREGCNMAEDSGYACTCGLASLLKQLE